MRTHVTALVTGVSCYLLTKLIESIVFRSLGELVGRVNSVEIVRCRCSSQRGCEIPFSACKLATVYFDSCQVCKHELTMCRLGGTKRSGQLPKWTVAPKNLSHKTTYGRDFSAEIALQVVLTTL